MRIAIKETKVFKFNELSEEGKEKAIGKLYDINIDHEWYDFLYDEFKEDLKKIGIECQSFYFDLDRGNYIAMDKPCIIDTLKFLKHCKTDLRTKEGKELYNITIDTNYYAGGRTSNSIDGEICNDVLQNILNGFLGRLKKEYEYLTSKEAIIETIESNEFEFTDEGNIY